jgi:hypothetical protein
LLVGAIEVRELLATDALADELRDHALRSDEHRGGAVAERDLELGLGLGHARVGRRDERRPSDPAGDGVARRAERREPRRTEPPKSATATSRRQSSAVATTLAICFSWYGALVLAK